MTALTLLVAFLALLVGGVALAWATELKEARRRDLIRAERLVDEIDALKRRP